VKIGDLVRATPAPKWDMDPEDNIHLGVVTKLAHSFDGYKDQIILLSFGDDDGVFCTNDWRFEVVSETR
tara:strand:- start:976 stop:1182 length:207 start_codon:yes stop_codon:yes gene_type:complete